MIVLILGASHTGKTLAAQKILERYHYPYLSLDHLKMGFIRSGNTDLTVFDDDALTEYLWPIAREMVKTALENRQNLVVEGCYIPFDWAKDFSGEELRNIRFCCLLMSDSYIENHFDNIQKYANSVEHRLDDSGLDKVELKTENAQNLEMCRTMGLRYILLEDKYSVTAEYVVEGTEGEGC